MAAADLLVACLNSLERDKKVRVDVLEANEKAIALLARALFEKYGFERHSMSFRMYFGRKADTRIAEGLFGIGRP